MKYIFKKKHKTLKNKKLFLLKHDLRTIENGIQKASNKDNYNVYRSMKTFRFGFV